MKKLLSVFLTVLFVFSAVTVIASAASITKDEKGIFQTNFLDFTPDTNNLWAEYDEANDKWSCIIPFNAYEQPEDADGNLISPYVRDYSSFSARSWSLIEDGEVLHLECTASSVYPGISFIIDEYHINAMMVGKEDANPPKAEYVKIRVRNHSTADQITFAFCHGSTNSYKFMEKSLSELTVDANGKRYESSGEWQTYIFSMATINQETNYGDLLYDSDDEEATPTHCWNGGISEFLIFPFGYNVTDGTGSYPGAAIDIDYVVIGSKDYVTNYKSALEVKEESISNLELISAPTKTEYRIGEALDLDGLELKATYNDGTTEILNSASANVSTFSTTNTKDVTLKFGAKTVNFPVSVTGIEKVEIIAEPESKVYEAAALEDGFVTDGFKYRVTYTDGTTNEDLPATIFRYSGDFKTAGTQTVTANYFGTKIDFEIEVKNVTDLEITSNKTYRYGDAAAEGDFSFNFVYSDGSTVASGDAETELEYTITCDTKTPGEVMATITAVNDTYGINITKEVPVNVEVPTGIIITTAPTKNVYEPEERFDPTGMVVQLVYGEGTTAKKVTLDAADYSAKANTNLPGKQPINVTCNIPGLSELKLQDNGDVNYVTINGEDAGEQTGDVNNPEQTGEQKETSTKKPNKPITPAKKTSGDNTMMIIIIAAAVVAVAAVVVVILVVSKKKKK